MQVFEAVSYRLQQASANVSNLIGRQPLVGVALKTQGGQHPAPGQPQEPATDFTGLDRDFGVKRCEAVAEVFRSRASSFVFAASHGEA